MKLNKEQITCYAKSDEITETDIDKLTDDGYIVTVSNRFRGGSAIYFPEE